MKQGELADMEKVVNKANGIKGWIGRLMKWKGALQLDLGVMAARDKDHCRMSSSNYNVYEALTPDCMKSDLIAACDKAIEHFTKELEELSYEKT